MVYLICYCLVYVLNEQPQCVLGYIVSENAYLVRLPSYYQVAKILGFNIQGMFESKVFI